MIKRRERFTIFWEAPNQEIIESLEVRNEMLVVKLEDSNVVYLLRHKKETATSGNHS